MNFDAHIVEKELDVTAQLKEAIGFDVIRKNLYF